MPRKPAKKASIPVNSKKGNAKNAIENDKTKKAPPRKNIESQNVDELVTSNEIFSIELDDNNEDPSNKASSSKNDEEPALLNKALSK